MQDSALQSLGHLFAARPALLQSQEVVALMRSVLQPSSPAAFKTRLLTSLTDLLRARRYHASPHIHHLYVCLSVLLFDPSVYGASVHFPVQRLTALF